MSLSRTRVTCAAFVHLRGIHTLNMHSCNQVGITDEAFAHLKGIHALYMSNCTQEGITDAAFAHIIGVAHNSVEILDISRCSQLSDALKKRLRVAVPTLRSDF